MKKALYSIIFLAISLNAGAQSSTTISIKPATTYQTIHSFGASDCWTADYVGRYFSDTEKAKAARWLFSSETDADGNPLGIAASEPRSRQFHARRQQQYQRQDSPRRLLPQFRREDLRLDPRRRTAVVHATG